MIDAEPSAIDIDTYQWYLAQERYPIVNPHPRHRPPRALTYEPKIGPVLRGDCTQTIRRFNPDPRYRVLPGDELTLHGWRGKPYWSKWSKWRLHVTVSEVEELHVLEDGFRVVRHFPESSFTGKWASPLADYLAQRDFISPPTGTELRRVLGGLNRKFVGQVFNIIRWDPELNLIELRPDQDGHGGSP